MGRFVDAPAVPLAAQAARADTGAPAASNNTHILLPIIITVIMILILMIIMTIVRLTRLTMPKILMIRELRRIRYPC